MKALHNYTRSPQRLFGLALLFILLAMVFTSCVTYQKCQDKFGTGQDSVKVPVVLKTELPAASSKITFTHKMIYDVPVGGSLKAGKDVKAVITRTSKDIFECEGATETKIVEVQGTAVCPPVNNFRPDPVILRKTPFWNWVLIILLAAGLILQTLRYYFKGLLSSWPDHTRP